ncbi:MAG: hypothetical protein E7574_07080 [Ruminococcaceae bacterium]|nr:hypothetical protein [Oscillospiraceae bacterium]
MKSNGLLDVFKKHIGIVLLIAILLIQVISLVYIGTQKSGLHIDENYSYILSNSYDTDRISKAPEVWNNWIDGDMFREFLTVEKGEQFAYDVVHYNNGKDAHPPLFYFLLHTLCSFLPGVWSPWIGMIMNIIMIVLAQIILYKLSRELMGDSLWSIVPVALYGGMQVFADTAIFIRMYSLMTLLTMLLVWQHYQLVTKEKKYPHILWCGILTFLGTFTQYCFAIFAFFLAAATCIHLLTRKKWKPLFLYAAAMLLAVVLVFVVFPAGISQITGSETNNIGNEVAGNILNISKLGRSIFSMGKQTVFGIIDGLLHCLPIVAVIALVTAAVLIKLRFDKKQTDETTENFKKILVFGVILAIVVGFAILTITHVVGNFVYVRYLYNLFPLLALLIGMASWLFAERFKLDKKILAYGLVAICLVSTITIAKEDRCSYLFKQRSKSDNEIITMVEDKPLIVLNNGSTYQPTALLHIFFASDKMYMANFNNIESTDNILEQVDCSNGVVFLVLTDTVWSSGFNGDNLMDGIIEQSEILESYQAFGKCDFTTAYIAYP